MESFYNEMITSEISFLEEEIQRLEIEFCTARHSTPLVIRHAGKQNLTQQTPRYITTTDQMTDYIDRQTLLKIEDTWQAEGARQTIW